MPRREIEAFDVPGFPAFRYPQAHVLTKSPGAAVNASWPCQNSGGGSPSVQIRFEYTSVAMGGQFGTNGPLLVVPGGQTVTLAVESGVHPAEPNGVTMPAKITMFEAGKEANPFATHPFSITTPPIFLVIVTQDITRTFGAGCESGVNLCYTWSGSVKNNDAVSTRFFRPIRTETSPEFGGPTIRRLATRTVGPGATTSWSSGVSTAASRVFGEMWVEETTSGGVFIQDILPKKAYDVIR